MLCFITVIIRLKYTKQQNILSFFNRDGQSIENTSYKRTSQGGFPYSVNAKCMAEENKATS